MIPNQWYAILDTREVPHRRPVGVTRMGEKLVLWRDGSGAVTCQRDSCPHRGAALSAGTVTRERIICPFHGFAYDPSGRCTLIPANGNRSKPPVAMRVHTYPVREAHGFIWIYWGEPSGALPALPFFTDLDDTFSYATYPYRWHTHYSRAIENQLDVVHLPFVHASTIGRGGRTLINGPLVEREEDTIRLWVYNRKDNGALPVKAGDLPRPSREPLLYFRFPSIWQNNIAPAFRIVIAFAPVDESNCILYLRVYQRFIRLPILRAIVNAFALVSSIYIARQDKAIVETQRPARSDLHVGEFLIPGDSPIIVYRRHRRALLDAAGLGETE